jgi:DNA invertase Pin-like site-specific DNA recombinase
MAMMRIATYARVSTRNGRQDTENQLRLLRQFAATQGWTVVHEYEDQATGKHGDRDQFQKKFAAASRREFDCLLFWSLDRLSREGTVQTLNHLQRLTGYGVNYRSFTVHSTENRLDNVQELSACGQRGDLNKRISDSVTR